MISTCHIRVVSSGEWRLRNLYWAYCIVLLSKYGSKSAYDISIGVNSTGFFSKKFLPWLVLWSVLGVVFGLGCAMDGFCGRFRGDLCG